MKTSAQKATPEEAAQILSLHQDYLTPCRKLTLESASKGHPEALSILVESYARADANYAKFVTYKISWSEFLTENQAIIAQLDARLAALPFRRRPSRRPRLQRTLGTTARRKPGPAVSGRHLLLTYSQGPADRGFRTVKPLALPAERIARAMAAVDGSAWEPLFTPGARRSRRRSPARPADGPPIDWAAPATLATVGDG
jgi:hypothetical protein